MTFSRAALVLLLASICSQSAQHPVPDSCPQNSVCIQAGVAPSGLDTFWLKSVTRQHVQLDQRHRFRALFRAPDMELTIATFPRGGSTFSDIAWYAYNCGADGVIIYDENRDNVSHVNMYGLEWPDIPVLLVGREFVPFANNTAVTLIRTHDKAFIVVE